MITTAVLRCVHCGGALTAPLPDRLQCGTCAAAYDVRSGVPILLREPSSAATVHEAELGERPVYSPWKERLILKALSDAQVALDFGAGRQVFDDPCILKLDIVFDPTLDLVGDLHEIPLQSESLDFAFGGAVMEHVRDPARAIAEIYRVLKPGGYVYADWSFLAAYHGYPHHYFNVTLQGIRQAFSAFTCLETGVGPHLGPSWALRSVLGTYLAHFEPRSRLDREFVQAVHRVLWHPLDELDRRIPNEDQFRTAAGVYFFGVKQPSGDDSVLPRAVLDAHARRADLQARFPAPLNVAVPDNLMTWARRTGVLEEPEIRRAFEAVAPFSKDGRVYGRRAVHDWPDTLMEQAVVTENEARRNSLWFSRPLGNRLLDSWDERGVAGLVRCLGLSALRATQMLRRRSRQVIFGGRC